MTTLAPPREVLRTVAPWAFMALAVLPLTWLLPAFDLTAGLARTAIVLSDSGKYGMPFLCAVALAVVVSRPGLTGARRAREAGALTGSLLLFLGVGAVINEHLVKPALGSPRPNIEELARRGLLTLSPERFYALGDPAARSAYLEKVLGEGRLPMSAAVRAHWVTETGFSFPSGHSTAAMLVATFFACVVVATDDRRRRWLPLVLLPWAVLVCFARPVLRVHRPVDVTLGGLQGVLLGVSAYLLVHALVGRRAADEIR